MIVSVVILAMIRVDNPADETLDFTLEQVKDIEGLNGDELYNPTTGEFETPPPRKNILSKLELIQQLTPVEQMLFFLGDAEGVPATAKIPLKLFAKQIRVGKFHRPRQRKHSGRLVAIGAAWAVSGRASSNNPRLRWLRFILHFTSITEK